MIATHNINIYIHTHKQMYRLIIAEICSNLGMYVRHMSNNKVYVLYNVSMT
jgi:hypothetical protein